LLETKTEPIISLESNRIVSRLPNILERAREIISINEVLLDALIDNEVNKN